MPSSPLEAPLHRFLRHHVVHGEVLADVAQELEQADRPSQSALFIIRAALGVASKSRKRSSCARMPRAFASISSIDSSVRSWLLPLGIADHPGAAADEGDRRVAEALQPRQRHDRQQRSDVQARRGRIETNVAGDALLREHVLGTPSVAS